MIIPNSLNFKCYYAHFPLHLIYSFDEDIKISSLLRAKAYDKIIERLSPIELKLAPKQLQILAELYLYKRNYKRAAEVFEKLLSMKIETKKTQYQLAHTSRLLLTSPFSL